MRTGEVCGLTWDDIDFEKETINIQHNVYDKPKDGKGRWYIGTTKTETGTRKIHLSQTLKIALQNYKKKQDYFKKIYGRRYIYYNVEDVKNQSGKVVEHRIVREELSNKDSKKINLIIPEGVTLEQTSITIKPKDKESLIQRIIYNKDEVELINNSNDIKETDLNIPDSINVEVQLEDSDTTISKSDISLYIDLENGYDEDKEYTINYKSDLEFKNIKIIPSTVGR